MSEEKPKVALDQLVGRRTACKVCIGAMATVAAGIVAYPVLSFLGQPVRLGLDKPVEVPLDQLKPGQAMYVELRGQQIIILTSAKGTKVFSASCPHLGCSVMWDTGDSLFHCPCHGAVFDGAGQVVRGPVSTNLKELPFETKDGKIIVS